MKQGYISIITSELGKLNEDQLYKVLVLVKNTIDANNAPISTSKNKPLCVGGRGYNTNDLKSILTKEAGEEVRKIVHDLGFVDCYGIFDVISKTSLGDDDGLSIYVSFCLSNKFDAMVEIIDHDNSPGPFYLSIKEIDKEKDRVETFYTLKSLAVHLKKIAIKYNKS